MMNTNLRESFASGSNNFICFLGDTGNVCFGSSHIPMFTYISSTIDQVDLESDTDFSQYKDFCKGKERNLFTTALSQEKIQATDKPVSNCNDAP